MSIRVTNIQRMCFDDGPGIRTTVFLKGCSIHCPWCSNPENIAFMPETYIKDGTTGIYGKEYSASDLAEVLLKDRKFWGNEGGITFSGGEALMQAEVLVDVLRHLTDIHVHIAVETALFVSEDKLQMVLPYIDYFIVDIKILDKNICEKVLGGNIELYQNNINILYQSGKLKLFRIPCCPEYTFTDSNKELLQEFLEQYPNIPVQLFAIHDLGSSKYEYLGRSIWKTKGMEEKLLADYCEKLCRKGIRAEVIHI